MKVKEKIEPVKKQLNNKTNKIRDRSKSSSIRNNIIVIIFISIFLSFNNNLSKENSILGDNTLITTLLTLLGFSIAFIAIFYTFIQLISKNVTKPNEITSIHELKQNIYCQFGLVAFLVVCSLINGNTIIYKFLCDNLPPCVFNFLLSKSLQVISSIKIIVLFMSLYLIFDIIRGIFDILENSFNIN